jgi:hypothetical protein
LDDASTMYIVESNSNKQGILTNGKDYSVYCTSNNPIKLNLSNGNYQIDWINPQTGKLSAEKEIDGGAHEFSPLHQTPVVLWIHAK